MFPLVMMADALIAFSRAKLNKTQDRVSPGSNSLSLLKTSERFLLSFILTCNPFKCCFCQANLNFCVFSNICLQECIVSQKKKITITCFNTNCRTKMKLVPIIMDYCLLQFDALKFFLRVHLHGVST